MLRTPSHDRPDSPTPGRSAAASQTAQTAQVAQVAKAAKAAKASKAAKDAKAAKAANHNAFAKEVNWAAWATVAQTAQAVQDAQAAKNNAFAIAKEVNVLLKLLADKSGKYKQLSVELAKAAEEDVSTSFGSMLSKYKKPKKNVYASIIYIMLKVLASKSGKEMMNNKEYKQLSHELVETASDEREKIMLSLTKGEKFMEVVELKELIVATKDELLQKGLVMAYEFSSMDRTEKDLDRYIAGDGDDMIEKVPQWPKNKDELITDYNDTWQCFHLANIGRKVTRKEWKVARVQVRNGIFYPIESCIPEELSDPLVSNPM